MGLLLKGDFETEVGQSSELYLNIEGFNFRKADMSLFAPMAVWSSKEGSRIINKVIWYNGLEEDGVEVEIPNIFRIKLTDTVTLSEPIYEIREVAEEVPYISFDEEGEEITKYRKVLVEKKVAIGEEDVEQEIENIKLVQQDIFKTIYNHIEKELTQLFPICIITHD